MKLFYDVIVCYDINDNKKRKEVFEKLRDLGLSPIQKSVFWGKILPAEQNAINYYLESQIQSPNKAILIKGSFTEQLQKNSYGYKYKDWELKTHECV